MSEVMQAVECKLDCKLCIKVGTAQARENGDDTNDRTLR